MKNLKLLFCFTLLCLIMSCADESSKSLDLNKVHEIQDVSESRSEVIQVEPQVWGKIATKDFASWDQKFQAYQNEKNDYNKEKPHFHNTLSMWHVNFYNDIDQIPLEHALIILDDMDKLLMNTGSFDTYYRLCNKFSNRTAQINKNRLNVFFEKNIKFLEKVEWNNVELQKEKIQSLRQTHFVDGKI